VIGHPDVAPDPVRVPAVVQRWETLTFLHWRFPSDVAQAILPTGLVVDTFDGSAWVALVPFRMVRVRPPWAPPLGPLTTFPETNVRTYVVGPDGGTGVYFCSLEITRLLGVAVARTFFHVPYTWARMSMTRDGRRVHYRSERRWPKPRGATCEVEVDIDQPAEPSALTRFLTNRWRAYTTLDGGTLAYAPVAHPPWSLHSATVRSIHDDLLSAAGLPPPAADPIAHFSEGVAARVGRLRRITNTGTSSER
jgi:uncharacterized protein YqjF (DUF2071 family)